MKIRKYWKSIKLKGDSLRRFYKVDKGKIEKKKKTNKHRLLILEIKKGDIRTDILYFKKTNRQCYELHCGHKFNKLDKMD